MALVASHLAASHSFTWVSRMSNVLDYKSFSLLYQDNLAKKALTMLSERPLADSAAAVSSLSPRVAENV